MREYIKVVVLDCDGVILETVEIKTRAFIASVEEYGPEAQKLLARYHLEKGGLSRFEKYRHFFREFVGREATDEDLAELGRRFELAAVREVMQAPFVPGAREFIEEFSTRLPLYVASGAPQEELRYLLKLRGLTDRFQGIFGSPESKPSMLARILRKEAIPPQELLMVGDSVTDLEAAQSVGARFFGRGPFAEPVHREEDLTGLGAFVENSGS